MGAGKTTVGRELARRIGRTFIDCDQELEERLGVRVSTVFEIEGEAGFRVRESRLLAELVQRNDVVLATGGGMVVREENRAQLAQHCLVAYLRVPPRALWERLRHDRTRPLLQVPNPRARIETLFREREPLYCEVADVILDGGRGSAAQMALRLEGMLAQFCEQHGEPAHMQGTEKRLQTNG
ncbi:MAG: shikimate kinase [Rhodocyclaceae bacterium]|nr:shikimate kinase [Rhodocyclaceae bacterium]MBR4737036.1 shikimate kinase [Rhodocyclaceae bacterium]